MAKQGIGHRLVEHSRAVILRIFPKRISFPEKVTDLLKTIYPSLDQTPIKYYEGLPWFIDQSFAHAITLPGVYNMNRIHIYFSNADFTSRPGLSTIVHECFHALQYQELYKSRGVGLFRIFLVHYLAEFFKRFFQYIPKMGFSYARQLAYDQHSMEIPAFEIDQKFQAFFTREEWLSGNRLKIPDELIIHKTGHEYKAGRMPYWSSVVLLFFLTVLAPFIEFFLLIYSGICFVPGKLLSILGL